MKKPALPVLDLRDLHAGPERRQAFLKDLRTAARDVGFFYLTGHGLGLEKQKAILALAKTFFALPEKEKLEVQMANSPHFRGYTRMKGEITRGKPDMREQFDIMAEEKALVPGELHAPWQRLYGPNQWPAALPQMQGTLLAWQDSLSDITVTLLKAFAEALEQDPAVFAENIDGGPYRHMKLIRYPGQEGQASRQGVGAHKDPGYLTLVMQDGQSGLEVQTEEGWVSAEPIEGAFVVNIGELLELASNGYLRATLHRVVSPQGGVERYSCAFFMAARLDSRVPLLALPERLAAQARGPESDPANPLFYEVGENVLKGRLRSHTDVAERHYSDLMRASA
ncbi:2-oxoglutarate and iron-dependent oxygenase domain-containing protein [Gallaecimonas kandeliae]|uniref:isopenicillin N synthase family dioxygenase n=1 Tax=Gallaecimonas kandeliae TaxID=3029055 RepID=UPI002649D6F9|nr:2-oxoglutarate and iron-dependent oxygenase domain-containing protein [Gallaecimonas kandeliae]WKE65091.1 2-oxoglutarate and iron-dependent oxygenase domain-containing protein [Gallaecimonas kandeliae]